MSESCPKRAARRLSTGPKQYWLVSCSVGVVALHPVAAPPNATDTIDICALEILTNYSECISPILPNHSVTSTLDSASYDGVR